MAKMARETLTPWTMLFTHVLKIVTSCASLAIDIVMYIERKDRHYSLIGLGMDAGLMYVVGRHAAVRQRLTASLVSSP